MGREFKDAAGTRVASWSCEGVVLLRSVQLTDSLPAFIEWLQAGPPKKRYRFRDGVTFAFLPDYVAGREEPGTGFAYTCAVEAEDIEEVWE